MDNTHYWFTFSLATADLLIGVSIFPSIFFCNLFDAKPCDWYIQLFVFSAFIYVSVSSVTTTIFGHYITMAFPFRYATLMKASRVWKIILFSWVMPLTLGLLPLVWENVRNKEVLKTTEKYYAGMLVIFEIIPFLIFLWISIHLIKIVKRQKNKIQAQCNVQGHLSPTPVRKSFDNQNSSSGTKTNFEVTEISMNQDSAFSISKPEISDGINPNGESFSTIPETSRKPVITDHREQIKPNRSNYLYSMNNWLPSLPRRPSSETRTSLDMSDFTSSISLANSKEILNRIRMRQFRDQRHRSVLISCLLAVFMICYVLTLANASCVFLGYCSERLQSTNFKIITLFFELLNSTLNPLLFILLGKDLRRKVAKLFCCKN